MPSIHSRPVRAASATAIAAVACLAIATVAASPAMAAAPPAAETFFSSSATDWVVPAGVHWIDYEAVGGVGGASWEGGSFGGAPATVTGMLAVTPGDVLTIWAGEAGGEGGFAFDEPGAGGAGYLAGGNGGAAGLSARPGGGGGGASAISVNGGAPSVVAAGGGGAGGRGGLASTCPGGNGGVAGEDGDAAQAGSATCNPTQLGGDAGTDAALDGQAALDVPTPLAVNPFLGGAGGGGAGGGGAGMLDTSGAYLDRNSGGGGGGGGASLGDSVEVQPAMGDGVVTITYAVAYSTSVTAVASPSPAQPGQEVTVTATVVNTETDDDPIGTVDFGIAGCAAVALVPGASGDGTATAVCTFSAGEPAVTSYDILYAPAFEAPFAGASTVLDVTVQRLLTATGPSSTPAAPALGALALLTLGGAVILTRRRRAGA